MIINKEIKKTNNKITSKFYKYYFLFTIFTFGLLVYIFFNLGIWESSKKEILYKIHNNGIVNYKYAPKMLVYALKKKLYSYKTIYVHINQKNKIALEKNRLDKNNYISSQNSSGALDLGEVDFISANASITSENKKIKTNIRLKGDRDIHFKNTKNSSYKFNLKGKNTIWGLEKFSIQKPIIRNYLHEWIFHELMSEGDLIKIKYDFIYFNLNGQNMGLYVLEEGFGKELLERNKRRNGPIFSLNEAFEWEDIYKAKFEVYDKKNWLKKENINVPKKAIENFKNFLNDKIKLEEIFDIKKWAWYFAVADLTYTHHGVLPKSVRFYYNPINGKFEPIPYDGHRMHPNYSKYLHDFDHKTIFDRAKIDINKPDKFLLDKFLNKFFFLNSNNKKLNELFYFEYIKAIKKISSKKFLDDFFELRENEINKITSAIYSDSFKYADDWRRKSGIGLYYYDKRDIYFRANKLLNLFSPKKSAIFIEDSDKSLVIHNKHIHNINLNLSEIVCEVSIEGVTILKNTSLDINLKYPKHILSKEKIFPAQSNKCNYLSFIEKKSDIRFNKKIDEINGNQKLSKLKNENYKKYFLKKGNNLFLKKDVIEISENILIPKNNNIIIKSGEKILLKNNAFIFSKSPWQIGGKGEKVFIGGEANNFGGGLLIFDTNNTSTIQNTNFEYLKGLQKNDNTFNYLGESINNYQSNFILFGSINFYKSNLEIKNTSFRNILSEDAINIIKSDYIIKDTKFSEIFADAIDLDFSNGKVIGSNFENIGNDAIDFSGSKSSVLNSNFNNIGDKVISIGELSEINISDIKAINSYIGVVSKDGSKAFVNNVQFNNVEIPFAAYKKKNQYSFAKMNISNIKADDYLTKSIRDKESKIFERNKEIGKFDEDILTVINKNN
jgi:hypothetical protein